MHLHDKLTCAELTRLTALTPQIVSNIAAELERMDFLTNHQPRRTSGRGQPAVPVSLNPTSAWSIGIHLDHRTLTVVLADLTGEVHFRRLILMQKPQPGATFTRLAEMLNEIHALPTLDWSRVLGMGVVMPGPSGVGGTSPTGPTTLSGWEGVDIAAELRQLGGLSVTFESDIMVVVTGERFHSMARQLSSLVYPYIGTGLGAGIFTDGHVYTGHAHNAGEVGHIVAAPNGHPCYCGNEERLERYVPLQAAYEFCGLGLYRVLPEDLLSMDITFFDQWITSILALLRQAINSLECIFDAEMVVVGGMMSTPSLEKVLARLSPLYQSVHGRYLPA